MGSDKSLGMSGQRFGYQNPASKVSNSFVKFIRERGLTRAMFASITASAVSIQSPYPCHGRGDTADMGKTSVILGIWGRADLGMFRATTTTSRAFLLPLICWRPAMDGSVRFRAENMGQCRLKSKIMFAYF